MRIPKSTLIIAGLAVAGFLFRLWMVRAVPQPFVYDQYQYLGVIMGILKQGFYADYSRLYGYSLLIAPIMRVFGFWNPVPWQVFHAVVDTGTAMLVYWIALKVFRNNDPSYQTPQSNVAVEFDSTRPARLNVPAWIAFVLYLFNPFTSAYVGVLLTEVVAVFFAALLIWIILIYLEKPDGITLGILAVLLGYYVQIKPGFLWFTIFVLLGCVVYRIHRTGRTQLLKTVSVVLVSACLFFVPFTYTMIANGKTFGVAHPMMVDRVFVRELYISLFVDKVLPFPTNDVGIWPPEVQQAWGDFSVAKNEDERRQKAQKYLGLSLAFIRQDPAKFVSSRIKKLWYIWEKHYFYPYVVEAGGTLAPVVWWGNNALLLLSVLGFWRWLKAGMGKTRTIPLRWFAMFVIGTVVYISLAHTVSTSEERFSLPAYPLVMVFAGYGIWRLGYLFGFSHQGKAVGATRPSLLS